MRERSDVERVAWLFEGYKAKYPLAVVKSTLDAVAAAVASGHTDETIITAMTAIAVRSDKFGCNVHALREALGEIYTAKQRSPQAKMYGW